MEPAKETRYWFKNKKYGIGWTPSSWQGWLVIAVYIIAVFLLALEPFYVDGQLQTGEAAKQVNRESFDSGRVFLFFLLFATFSLVMVKKGEKLRPNFISKLFKKIRGDEQI